MAKAKNQAAITNTTLIDAAPLSKAAQRNAVKASTIIVELDKLAKVRAEFETTVLARTNQQLYQILGDVYAQYVKASESAAVLKDTLAAMKTGLEKNGVRVQKNSLAISVFVRYVFNSDRQRVHNYTRAIQAAISYNVSPVDIASFINNAGGIEECKQKVTPSKKQQEKKQKIARAMPLVEETLSNSAVNKPLAKFSVPAQFVAASYQKDFTFLIGKADKDGNVQVLSVIPAYSEGVEKWAKQSLATFLDDEQVLSANKAKEKAKAKAIDKAVARTGKKVAAEATVGEVMAA
jgi:hypothetical protein